ncbi:MAG: HAD family hydrolase [Ethanoligenens sp.]
MSGGNWIVFDLDGTLNRTDLVSVAAHQQAQREFGVPVRDAAFIISTFGGMAWDTFPLLAPALSDEERMAYTRRVAELEREFLPEKGRHYDGCDRMLQTLHDQGWHTAVCSNATVRYINAVLCALKLRPLIDEVRPLEEHMTKAGTLRLLLEKTCAEKAIMVGDRKYDKEAARENQIPFIGCLYGFAPDEVRDADHTVESPLDIVFAAEELMSAGIDR